MNEGWRARPGCLRLWWSIPVHLRLGSTYGVGTGIIVATWVGYWLTSVGSAGVHPRIWSLRHVLIALVAVVVAVVVTLVTGLLFKRRLEQGPK